MERVRGNKGESDLAEGARGSTSRKIECQGVSNASGDKKGSIRDRVAEENGVQQGGQMISARAG
eukprot:6205010-Pleurochrysis_carterae.AAC.4